MQSIGLVPEPARMYVEIETDGWDVLEARRRACPAHRADGFVAIERHRADLYIRNLFDVVATQLNAAQRAFVSATGGMPVRHIPSRDQVFPQLAPYG